jgi:hypothetical protein
MKKGIYIIAFIAFTLSATADNIIGKKVSKTSDVTLSVTLQNNVGEITWQGLSRLKVMRYELEKSIDGKNFSYVTAVAGNNGNYALEDRNISENVNYYRLKIVSKNGNVAYSTVASIDLNSTLADMKVLPTQLDQKLSIWVPANTKISNASINDACGRQIIQHAAIDNAMNFASVEIASLPVGLYKINLTTNKGETKSLKFTKQ